MTVEPVVVVLVDSQSTGICRSCKARIVWYRTVGGKMMPFDGAPALTNVRRDQTSVDAPWVGEAPRHLVHWATCPDADSFRKRER